jgi:hypothetical protein
MQTNMPRDFACITTETFRGGGRGGGEGEREREMQNLREGGDPRGIRMNAPVKRWIELGVQFASWKVDAINIYATVSTYQVKHHKWLSYSYSSVFAICRHTVSNNLMISSINMTKGEMYTQILHRHRQTPDHSAKRAKCSACLSVCLSVCLSCLVYLFAFSYGLPVTASNAILTLLKLQTLRIVDLATFGTSDSSPC